MKIQGLTCAELIPVGTRIEQMRFRSTPAATPYPTYRQALFDAIIRDETASRYNPDRDDRDPLSIGVYWRLALPDNIRETTEVLVATVSYPTRADAAESLESTGSRDRSVPDAALPTLVASTLVDVRYTVSSPSRGRLDYQTRQEAMNTLLDAPGAELEVGMHWVVKWPTPGTWTFQVAEFVYDSRADLEADLRVEIGT